MFSILKTFLFANTSTSQTIAKNTVWLFFGQMTSRVLRAAIVIYAARVLGAGSWGAFSYALGIVTFLTTFSDIGINALITKEAVRYPDLKDRYLSTAFFMKLTLLSILVGVTLIAFPYLTNIPEAAAIMPILIFVFVFDTLRDLGSAISRAMEKMQIEALTTVFANFAITALGFVFLWHYGTGFSLALAYAIGSAAGLIAIFFAIGQDFRTLVSNFSSAFIKPILTTAWPFALLSVMGIAMLNTDIIMLGWMRSVEEVGYYSAAQKLIQLLYVIPALVASSVFPVLARFTQEAPEMARMILQKVVRLMFALSLPIALIGIFFGSFIITLLFGAEYVPAILTFQILIATVLIVYPSTPLGNAIFAYDQQKSFIGIVAVALIGNVAFNLLLIPRWGIEGAAISTIITQLLTNGLIWAKMRKILTK